MKEWIEKKLQYCESNLRTSLSTFLYSNKRVDRDRVLKWQTRVETYKEIMESLNDKV
jgi:hypothetical protein